MDILQSRGYFTFVRVDSGGQGNVYRTMKQGKAYAIKVVPVEKRRDGKPGNPDDDLKRELSIARGLRHPNCIRVVDLFRTKTRVYLVMDFMPNGNIGTVVRKNGPLCEWNVKIWFPSMCKAVAYLHTNTIAHRDLKLDNILLDQYFNPIVSDFGFSRTVQINATTGIVTKSDTYCGTQSYNPPEILKHILYDPFKADIWCSGVMLFIMVNKIYPFDRHEGKERMYTRQMARDYHLQEDIEQKSSVELKDLIRVMLEPDATKRPDIWQVLAHAWIPIIHREDAALLSGPTGSINNNQ